MNSLILNQTDDCPKVVFSYEDGKLEIGGKSLPEDVNAFYDPVLEWLSLYLENPQKETEVAFKFTYFNTASSKIILDILNFFEKLKDKGFKVTIKWYYPEYDEDMRDAGIEYSEMVDVPFEHYSFHP